MSQQTKTDNRSLASKIALRRWLLSRLHLTDIQLLDTCAGAGHIWRTMQEHVTVSRWVRCDVKPRQAGTLQMTALQACRVLPLDDFTVIDIDPYGDPFSAYVAALTRITKPMAFFLTHGHVMQGAVTGVTSAAAGLPPEWPVPRTPSLGAFLAQSSLEATWRFATIQHSAVVRFPNVDYYALAVTPLNTTSA